jgi:Ca2+-binding EF-hand superfamily protein
MELYAQRDSFRRHADLEGYAGEVDDAGNPHGEGTMRYATGHEYRGQFSSGLRDGRGSFTFPDATEYDGGWRGGRQHGEGRLTLPSGEVINGTWWEGSMEGRGTYDDGAGRSFGRGTRSSSWHDRGQRSHSAPPEPPGLNASERRMWRAFCAADTDGSGALSRREFYAALEEGGLDMSTTEKLVTWEDYDRNGDGKISWREFVRVSRDLQRHGSDVPSALSTTPAALASSLPATPLSSARPHVRVGRDAWVRGAGRVGGWTPDRSHHTGGRAPDRSLSKRRFYNTLEREGLYGSEAEKLAVWDRYDRGGRVNAREFGAGARRAAGPYTSGGAAGAARRRGGRVPLAVRDTFAQFDSNRNGYLERGELARALDTLGFRSDSKAVSAAMGRYDDDWNGRLDVNEFAELFRDVLRHETPGSDLRDVFERHDRNRNGYLEVRELRAALAALGVEATAPAAAAVLREFDDDLNGRLDLGEFHQLVWELRRAVGAIDRRAGGGSHLDRSGGYRGLRSEPMRSSQPLRASRRSHLGEHGGGGYGGCDDAYLEPDVYGRRRPGGPSVHLGHGREWGGSGLDGYGRRRMGGGARADVRRAFEANCDGRELLSPLDVEQALMDCGFDLDDELDVMLRPLREHDAELALHEFDYLVAQLEDWVTERPLCALALAATAALPPSSHPAPAHTSPLLACLTDGHQFYTTAYHRVPYRERVYDCY